MTETPTHLREFEADLRVARVDRSTEGIVVLTLADPDGGLLPAWTPGAHIDLVITDELTRQYSLSGSPADGSSYEVGVLLADPSRGGSAYIHQTLTEGSVVRVRGPRNHFPLVSSPRYVFIAGGIGITPMMPMIVEAEASGSDWVLYYGGRSRATMAYLDRLAEYGDKVVLLARDEVDRSLSQRIGQLLGTPQDGTLVYCCGPEPLLLAVEDLCASWPSGTLHLERFQAKQVDAEVVERGFDVVLARSGITIQVPPDRSIFRVCEDNGVSVLGSCHEGICGTCEVEVLDGEVDHRDSILSADEQASNEMMMICVSRARSDSLTIDL